MSLSMEHKPYSASRVAQFESNKALRFFSKADDYSVICQTEHMH